MQFDRGYISPYMVTDTDKMEAVIDDALILITDKKISTVQDILPLLESVLKSGQKLVIIAEDVERSASDHSSQQASRHIYLCMRKSSGLRRQKKRYASGYRNTYRRSVYYL